MMKFLPSIAVPLIAHARGGVLFEGNQFLTKTFMADGDPRPRTLPYHGISLESYPGIRSHLLRYP